ncbi:hypothetical protein Glove_296g56 [Diversispora epigaea]|uniref:Uncharacterized protein n=1 Tax=Diversispora epigaea TaxID=1348612 RepID=A0A397HYF3_9GLOM|nr:hypothetical protein Glove_296g56 [Diversispora epigaea]
MIIFINGIPFLYSASDSWLIDLGDDEQHPPQGQIQISDDLLGDQNNSSLENDKAKTGTAMDDLIGLSFN